MEKKVKVIDDKQVEVGNEKKPYKTPELQRIGTVGEVTQGVPILPLPDVGGTSV